MDKKSPDYEGARQYALTRLREELAPELTYHNRFHTRDDVLAAVRRLAAMIHIGEEETRLLEIAALYHDLGFVVQRQEHERAGADIAAQVLPGLSFSPSQIATIEGMIAATRLPQSPHTLLEEILADADLDVLGRDDFLPRNRALQAELAALGTTLTDEEWYSDQLRFVQNHRYFTSAAHALRAEGKERNIEKLRDLLAQETET
jgi:uncharacterized protein